MPAPDANILSTGLRNSIWGDTGRRARLLTAASIDTLYTDPGWDIAHNDGPNGPRLALTGELENQVIQNNGAMAIWPLDSLFGPLPTDGPYLVAIHSRIWSNYANSTGRPAHLWGMGRSWETWANQEWIASGWMQTNGAGPQYATVADSSGTIGISSAVSNGTKRQVSTVMMGTLGSSASPTTAGVAVSSAFEGSANSARSGHDFIAAPDSLILVAQNQEARGSAYSHTWYVEAEAELIQPRYLVWP